MPKMKTHRGVAKRFKVTGSGRIKRAQAGKSHLLFSKKKDRKRRLRHTVILRSGEEKRIASLLPYA